MKKALITSALGSALLILVGGALIRRRTASEREAFAGPLHSSRGPNCETVMLEKSSPERSVPPGSGGLGLPSGAVRSMLGAGGHPPASPSGEVPDIESNRARRHAEQDFWEDLGVLLEARSKMEPAKYQEKVFGMTAAYLGWDPSRAAVFERSAARAAEEIGRAWKLRNESIEAISEVPSVENRDRKEQQIQEQYEAAKNQALAGLESLLESSPRQESFRRRLGEWFDAVR